MTSRIGYIEPAVTAYLGRHTTPPTAIEQRLIDETHQHQQQHAGMQIGHPQARFMAMLAGLLQPRLVIEIGTFTGYSALAVAQAIDPSATLIACDVSEEWTEVGQRYWEEAGVADRIDLRIGPASETLAALEQGTEVDLAFIDADKTGYVGYFEQLVPMLAPRGAILVDNVLWGGRVADPEDTRESTEALRQFSRHVLADERVDVALLPIGDGLSMITLAR